MQKTSIQQINDFFADMGFSKEKEYFLTNLSMLLEAGMSVSDAVSALRKESKSPSMRKLLASVNDDISNGFSVSNTLKRARFTTDHTDSLIKIGEESGKLSQNLKIIAVGDEKNRVFRSKIRSAMLYPMFIFGVTIIVGIVVVWYILPRLATVFSQMNIELPVMTRWLIAAGNFLAKYGSIFVPAVLVFFGSLFFFVFIFKKTKHIGQTMLLSSPGIGAILKQIEIAHMGYILGTLLGAGIPVVTSLNSLSNATSSKAHQNFYKKMKEKIADGNSFAKTFEMLPETNKFIPATVERLIVSGEQSGKLSDTLLKVGTHYESKIDDTTKNLSVIFEPILLVIVWVGVVAVALSVILPIYSLIGNFNR